MLLRSARVRRAPPFWSGADPDVEDGEIEWVGVGSGAAAGDPHVQRRGAGELSGRTRCPDQPEQAEPGLQSSRGGEVDVQRRRHAVNGTSGCGWVGTRV